MAPQAGEPMPVFSLMPAAGDVDIMITAEMMEAGRSIIRGFVTPDRTTLITSTHRALAVSRKDGAGRRHRLVRRGDGGGGDRRAPRSSPPISTRWRSRNGSVISASLFGALAGAGVAALPA